jgi:hypothetical protein
MSAVYSLRGFCHIQGAFNWLHITCNYGVESSIVLMFAVGISERVGLGERVAADNHNSTVHCTY